MRSVGRRAAAAVLALVAAGCAGERSRSVQWEPDPSGAATVRVVIAPSNLAVQMPPDSPWQQPSQGATALLRVPADFLRVGENSMELTLLRNDASIPFYLSPVYLEAGAGLGRSHWLTLAMAGQGRIAAFVLHLVVLLGLLTLWSARRHDPLFRWLALIGKDNAQFLATEPGIDLSAAEWLADQGIVAFGGDTWASEVYPNPTGEEFPVNQFMLAKRGIYNLELIDTRALVRDKAFEFLFVLSQPLYKGATKVNISPVAMY